MCLKKFLQDYLSSWKIILGKILSPVGGRFLLYCNFDTAKLKISLPSYYKECLDAWSELNRKTSNSSHEVINEIIWNNRLLCIDKMSIYRDDMIKLGFLKIGHVQLCGQITSLVLMRTEPHCYLPSKISF